VSGVGGGGGIGDPAGDHPGGVGGRVRYPQELRDTPERLASVLVPVNHGIGNADAAGGGSAMGGTGMSSPPGAMSRPGR
jgi:hypothetical protein